MTAAYTRVHPLDCLSRCPAGFADEIVNLPFDAEQPFPPDSFAVVICADILEMVAESGLQGESCVGAGSPA